MSIIKMHGTNIQRHQLLQTLRQNVSDEYNRLNNITNNGPKTFFNAIKRMTGNASNISPYIIHNEIKLYDPRQQEPIFRDYWKNIFTSEDPNAITLTTNSPRTSKINSMKGLKESPHTTTAT